MNKHIFTQRLNEKFVELGTATGPGLLYAQCSQAVNCCRRESPFLPLHGHALSLALSLPNVLPLRPVF